MPATFPETTIPHQDCVVFDLSSILHYPIKLAVEGWRSARPLHWFSFSDEGILAEGRFLVAPGLPLFTLEDDQGQRISDHMPENIASLAGQMPALSFELAQACAVSQAARELAVDAPLLFILLVNHARKEPVSVEAFEQLLSQKRHALLELIGLAANKSLVRLLKRIELSPMLPWELEDIVTALLKPEFQILLRHHANVHLNHLRFLLRHRDPLWPGMLHMITATSTALDIAWLCRMIRDVRNLANGDNRPLQAVDSHRVLQQVHDRLVERFNQADAPNAARRREADAVVLEMEHGDYPTPPLPAADAIEPLTTWLELLEEGATMHHCVGSYDVHVACGDVFIYRLKDPQRLTIALERKNRQWVLGEVRGYCNSNPSVHALEIIQRWVDEKGKVGKGTP